MSPHAEQESSDNTETTVNGQEPQTPPTTTHNNNNNSKKGKGKGKGKGNGDTQNKERIQRLDQIYNKKKRQTYFEPTPKSNAQQGKAGQTSHVVLKVRRIICDKGYPSGTEIDIKSELLKDALSDIFAGVEGLQLNETPPVITPELLFHARQGLIDRIETEKSKTEPNKARVDELSTAVQYIEEDFASAISSLSSLSTHGEITFDLLWALFPPNIAVWTKSNLLREPQVFKLQMGEYGKTQSGSRYYGMIMRRIAHDGEKFGWTAHMLKIEQFDGAKKVVNLDYVPLDHVPDKDAVCTHLQQRGRRFLELLAAPNGTYQEYTGPAVAENRQVTVDNEYKKVIIHISGRIMIDNTTLAQQNTYTDLLSPPVGSEQATSLTDTELLYCNHFLGGFAFRQKKWCLFAISTLRPITWNTNAFSKLVMEPKTRNLIHSLVSSHKHGASTFDDVVVGKGQGLVGLLSGSPGVGKTLTAEVIAEVTKRPLYMLSAGELGVDVRCVEKMLDMVLEITRQWGCVLLIDEADVFLQERDGLDLQRNAMVSIFLRRLEYFQGVLILTTNRKREIDPAFDSRIHFKLHYPELEPEARYAIWKNCLENAPVGVEKGGIDEKDLRSLAELKFNGRQIKNAVACAVSIAVEEGESLSMEGLRVILDMVLDKE